MSKPSLSPNDMQRLREGIMDGFNSIELQELCFDMSVNFENLPGSSKTEKVLGLIAYMERYGRVPELVDACSKRRPNLPWLDVGKPQTSKDLKVDQVAAICYRLEAGQVEFLLVRTSGGRWMFPKGKRKPKESLWQTAKQEAREEAGVEGKVDKQILTTFRYCWRDQELDVAGFLFKVESDDEPGEPGREPTWFTLEDAERALSENRNSDCSKELHRVVGEAYARIVSGKDFTP